MKEWTGSKWTLPGLVLAVLGVAACAAETEEPAPNPDEAGAVAAPAPARELGPVDGRDLPGTDLGRIAIGDIAPDFTLETYRGETLTLSENRGRREVLLVFYRGAW
jgi:hypothetical protein